MPKKSKEPLIRYTVCIPQTLNEEFREFLEKRNEKRQRAIREAIDNWMKQAKENEVASADTKDKDEEAA